MGKIKLERPLPYIDGEICIIPLQNGQKAICDADDYDLVKGYNWRQNKFGYIIRRNNKSNNHITLHRLINKTIGNDYTDHINHDKLDNRKINLRTCNNQQNQHNQKLKITNKSGYKGISWAKKSNKWLVSIKYNNKTINLGYFTCIKKAVEAYNTAAIKYFGEYASINKIGENNEIK